MNILGVGTPELLIILLIALVVGGPKRMVVWMYQLGRYVGMAKRAWAQMAENIQQELDEAGVELQVPKHAPTRADIDRLAENALRPFIEPAQQAIQEYKAEVGSINAAIQKAAEETGAEVKPNDAAARVDYGTWSRPAAAKSGEPNTTPPEAQ